MKRWFLPGLALAFVAQMGIVAAMVWTRAAVLRNGQEIAIRSTFIDPRDIFRGHYVRLNLTVDPPEDDIPGLTGALGRDDTAYITLRQAADGFWVAKAVHDDIPEDTSDPVLRIVSASPTRSAQGIGRFALPFDRYFADYNRSQALERLRRDQRLGVILALDGKGGAVIKGLTIDGESVYDEALF